MARPKTNSACLSSSHSVESIRRMVKRRDGPTRNRDGSKKTKVELCKWLMKHSGSKKEKKQRKSSSKKAGKSSSSASRSLGSIAKILAKKPEDCYKLKAKDLRKFVEAAGHRTRFGDKPRTVKKMCNTERRYYREQAKLGEFSYPYDASGLAHEEDKLAKIEKAYGELKKMLEEQRAKVAAAVAAAAASSDASSVASTSSAASSSAASSADAEIAAAARRNVLGESSAASSASSDSSASEAGEAGISVADATSAMGQNAGDGLLVLETEEDVLEAENDPDTEDGFTIMFKGEKLKFDGKQKKFVKA